MKPIGNANGDVPGAKPASFPADALLELHAALDVDALWSAMCAVLTRAMPHHHFVLALQCVGTMPMTVRLSMPVPDIPQYFAKLDAVAPLAKLIERMRGRKVSRMSDQIPRWLLPLTPFYRKIMKPEGWKHSVAMLFWEEDRLLAHFGTARAAADGDYTDAEMAVFEALHPHFEVALHRVLHFDRERGARAPLEVSVRNAPIPTAVLDWEMRVVFANRSAAEAAVFWQPAAPDARSIRPDFVLPAEVHTHCAALRASWEEAVATDRMGEAERHRTTTHPRRAHWRASVHLLPPSARQFSEPRFLIEFHHPPEAANHAVALETMLALLTPAEREVALHVAHGLDNTGIATALGLSVHTIRAHLRAIFPKLGVQSRTQLAARFQTGPGRAAATVVP